MSPEEARINELERIVEGLVAYLRRLPAHPATYQQAAEAERVLAIPQNKSSFVGACYYPDGVPLVALHVEGMSVTVQMQDVSGLSSSYQEAHKSRVLADLAAGVKVRIEPGSYHQFMQYFE